MIKKIITISILIGAAIGINWCTKKYTSEIIFDQFTFNVTTENTALEEINEEQKTIFAKEENLYKIYTIMNKSWFSDSLLIYKEKTSTQIPVERLMQLNIKKIENRLQWFKKSTQSKIDIKCWTKTITWYIQSISFNWTTSKSKIYINQYFFKDWDYLYILSSSTENSTNSKGTRKWFTSIQCNK